jgi:DNA-binding XRE family transcriptional regulator
MATTHEADSEHIHLLERVLANVMTNENGCWIWMAARTHGGYGALWLDGEVKYAHRVVGVIFLALDEQSGLYVLHDCDTPACCNPNHLRLGTHRENMADASAKGRLGKKLTPPEVIEIRRLRAEGGHTQQDLADRFGVSKTTIQQIERRETWRNLSEEHEPSPSSHTRLGDGDGSLAESA